MKHRYKITARFWRPGALWEDQELKPYHPAIRFGLDEPAYEELDDTEVIELIIRFGRATIQVRTDSDGEYRTLEFENDYD
jgi:hypothetical protein